MKRVGIVRVCLVTGTVVCAAVGVSSRVGPQFGTGIDIRDDSHHRIDAGLYVPEFEPMLVQASDDTGRRVRGTYVRAQSEIGRLFIWKDSFRELPIYLLDGAFDTHVEVAVPRWFNASIIFAQDPRHPFGVQERSEDDGKGSRSEPRQALHIDLPCKIATLFPDPGAHLRVTVCTKDCEPVSFALIRFDRAHFGAIAVQCDAGGAVRLSADGLFAASEAVVTAVTIEPGTLLGRRPLADVMRLAAGTRLEVDRVD